MKQKIVTDQNGMKGQKKDRREYKSIDSMGQNGMDQDRIAQNEIEQKRIEKDRPECKRIEWNGAEGDRHVCTHPLH